MPQTWTENHNTNENGERGFAVGVGRGREGKRNFKNQDELCTYTYLLSQLNVNFVHYEHVLIENSHVYVASDNYDTSKP